jgi:hypothetical protein
MLMALALVVVMATAWEAWLLAPAVKVTVDREEPRMAAPPPPLPVKVTVIGTGVRLTPEGPVGVRVTTADAPE